MRYEDMGPAVALGLALVFAKPALVQSQTSGVSTVAAGDGPGGAASWTTGNKLAVGTSAGTDSKVWFTVAKGITSEIFYPRLDVPNMEDMQYIITDGSTFVDLERDATSHVISMPTEDALEYIVTNTDKRQSPKYRITNTYVTDPSRDTLLIRTRFEFLDGGVYQLYLHANPSIAGGGANNSAWWDGTHSALMASGTRTLFGSPMTIVSALKVASPNGFVANDNGFATVASDCDVELHKDMALVTRFDSASNGNVVQCGEIGSCWRGYDVHGRARIWRRRCVSPCRGRGIACSRIPGSGDRLPQRLERLCRRASSRSGQRVDGYASAAGLLRCGHGAARRRGQDIPRRQHRRVRHAMGRFRQRRSSRMTAIIGSGAATSTSRRRD